MSFSQLLFPRQTIPALQGFQHIPLSRLRLRLPYFVPFSLISNLNMHFTQLLLGDFVWCTAHQILCVSVHRECDDFTDIIFVA